MRFKIGTINVKSNPLMRQAWVVSDITKAAVAFAVILGQEIIPPGYKRAWRAILAKSGLRTYGAAKSETPIGLSGKSFDLATATTHVIRVHRGYRRFSPARKIVVTRVTGRDGLPYSFVAMHCVNWAFKRGASRLPLRRKLFFKYWDAAQQVFTDEHKLGRNVFGGGDLNRTNAQGFGLFHPQAVRLADHGYDHIQGLAAPGFYIVRHDAQTTVGRGRGLHTDHAMIGRDVEVVTAA